MNRLAAALRAYGLHGTAELAITKCALTLFQGAFHKRAIPDLRYLHRACQSVHFSPLEVLRRYYVTDEDLLQKVKAEYEVLSKELMDRYQAASLSHPLSYAVEDGTALLLYALVRTRRPQIVLETGVANGHSTFYILSALAANGVGRLYSVDISARVGVLLREADKSRWELHILDKRRPRQSFAEIVAALPGVDLFIHDSDHTYWWQYYEYSVVAPKLTKQAILASDDADFSYAFWDFCRANTLPTACLVDKRKVFAFTVSG